MAKEEILNEYKDVINRDIEEYCKEYGLTASLEKEAMRAVRMLKMRDFFDDAKISSYTGLFS